MLAAPQSADWACLPEAGVQHKRPRRGAEPGGLALSGLPVGCARL